MGLQRRLYVFGEAPAESKPNHPPMTSRQVKEEAKKRSSAKGMSIAEIKEMNRLEEEELRRNEELLGKEEKLQIKRNRREALKAKKAAQQGMERAARRQSGLPPVAPKEGQTTLTSVLANMAQKVTPAPTTPQTVSEPLEDPFLTDEELDSWCLRRLAVGQTKTKVAQITQREVKPPPAPQEIVIVPDSSLTADSTRSGPEDHDLEYAPSSSWMEAAHSVLSEGTVSASKDSGFSLQAKGRAGSETPQQHPAKEWTDPASQLCADVPDRATQCTDEDYLGAELTSADVDTLLACAASCPEKYDIPR